MARGPVNQKDISTEFYYGYLNIHLEKLQKALLDKDSSEIDFRISELIKTRNILLKLGYFERGKKK